MSKIGLFLTSLVAAIPGALCAVLMVMAFLNHAGGPTTVIKVLNGSMVLIGGILTIMPVGILIFAGPKTEKAPKPAEEESAGKSEAEAGSDAEVVEEAEAEAEGEEAFEEEAEDPMAVTDTSLQVVEAEGEDFAVTGEVVTGDETAADEVFDSGEEFEVEPEAEEEAEAEEEEAPKKGKKK